MRGVPHVESLSPEQCLDRLGGAAVGQVAVSIEALPAIRSIRFALAAGGIIFRAAPHSRLRQATSLQVIAFHAYSSDPLGRQDWAVNVQGLCGEVTDPAEAEQLGALELPAWHDHTSSDVFMRLPITRIYGEDIHWR